MSPNDAAGKQPHKESSDKKKKREQKRQYKYVNFVQTVDEKFLEDQMHSCFAILTEEPGNALSK